MKEYTFKANEHSVVIEAINYEEAMLELSKLVKHPTNFMYYSHTELPHSYSNNNRKYY